MPEFIKNFAGKPYREILAQIYLDLPAALDATDIAWLVTEEENRAIEHLSLEARATEGTPGVLSDLRDRGVDESE